MQEIVGDNLKEQFLSYDIDDSLRKASSTRGSCATKRLIKSSVDETQAVQL